MCLYRENGLGNEPTMMCAAGCLMDAGEYDRSFEGRGWDDLTSNNLVPREHSDLICDLQEAHDNSIEFLWPDELRDTAARRALNTNVVDAMEGEFRLKLDALGTTE